MKNPSPLLLLSGFLLLIASALVAYRSTSPVGPLSFDDSTQTADRAPIRLQNDTLLTLGGERFGLRANAGTLSLRDSSQNLRLLDALNAALPRLADCLTPTLDHLTATDLRRTDWSNDRLGLLLDLDPRLTTAPAFRNLPLRDAVLTALVSRLRQQQPLYPSEGVLTPEAPVATLDEDAPAPPPAPDWTLPGLLFGLGLTSLLAGLLLGRRAMRPPASVPVPVAPTQVPIPVPDPPQPAPDKTQLHEQVLLALLRNYPEARRLHGPDVNAAALLATEYNQLISSDQDPFTDDEYQALVREAESLVAALHPHQDYARRFYETFYLTPEGRDVLTEWDQAGQTTDLVGHFVKTSTHARSFLKFYLGRTVGEEDELNRRLLLEGGRVPNYEATFQIETFRDDSRLMPPSVRLIQQLAAQHGVRDLDNVVFKNAVYIPRQALTPKP